MDLERNLDAENMVRDLLEAGHILSWFAGANAPKASQFYMDKDGVIYSVLVLIGKTKHTVESLTRNLLIYDRLDYIQDLHENLKA